MEEHNRSRTRVHYLAHALVKSNKNGTVKGTIRDIAIETLYVYTDPVFELDEQVNVEIIILGVNSQLTIKTPAKIVRKDSDGVAMRFPSRLEWWPIFSHFPLHRLPTQEEEKEKEAAAQ